MAIKAFSYFKKPVFLSSLICIFIFYSGLFNIPDKSRPVCLVPLNQVTMIRGKILSSPAKSSSGKYYTADMELEWVKTSEGILSSARGRAKVYIPSALAEA